MKIILIKRPFFLPSNLSCKLNAVRLVNRSSAISLHGQSITNESAPTNCFSFDVRKEKATQLEEENRLAWYFFFLFRCWVKWHNFSFTTSIALTKKKKIIPFRVKNKKKIKNMNKIRDLEKGRCSEKKKMTFIDYSTTWSLVQFHVDPTRYSIFVFHARRIPYVYLHIRPYVGSRFSNLNNWRKESNIPLLFFRYPGDKRQSQNIFWFFFFPKKDVRVSVTNSYVTRMYVKLSPSKPPNPTQPNQNWVEHIAGSISHRP